MSDFSKSMKEFNKKTGNAGNRFSGGVKKVAGKMTGNEQLELKGRIQIAKADFRESVDIKRNVSGIKERIARRINDRMDKKNG
jgi:uncharacterized protein YjbJ (UPF0337 family)